MDNDKQQHVSITNSQVQVVPNATGASITINGSQSSAAPQQPSAVIRHYITHDAVGVPVLIRRAHRYLVFHAAFYPKYGFDDQGQYVKEAMEQNPNLRLTAIFTDVHVGWVEEFARTLRSYFTAEEFTASLEMSRRHFIRCREQFGSSRVHICDTPRLPMFPVILIDDTLVIGHYAHSRVIPPHGLWITVQHPNIPAMYTAMLAGIPPVVSTPEESAILRYIEELIV